MRRVVIFDYNSLFSEDIKSIIREYNLLFPEKAFLIDICQAERYPFESLAGPANMIIHSGGDGAPVKEDITDIPKLYICHSHQWKAVLEGGRIVKLDGLIKGMKYIDVIEDDDILGKRGKMPVMQYHELAITEPPRSAKVLAISRAIDSHGEEIEIIEALKYPDGSISVQSHPEEGTAAHIFYNLFEKAIKTAWAFIG